MEPDRCTGPAHCTPMSREPMQRSRDPPPEVVNGAEARVPLSMVAAHEPHYNRKMLLFFRQQTEKAQSLWDPAKATRDCSSLFHSALGKATRLIRKHAQPFSICEFYRVDDVRAAVEEICELLRDILQECEMDSVIETRVHDNDYAADKQHLDMLLSCVLGVDCSGDVDATCLPSWNDIQNRHTSLLNSLKMIKDEELTVTNRKIGGGGEGSVYEADWQDARVAVKKLNTSGCQMDLEDVAEFYAEASIQSSLDHRNVVKLHAITTSGCFIMPIAESDLQKLYKTGEQIAWPVTRALLLQAANGLLHLHERNLVHCDVKSSNFLVFGKELSSCTVKIADFGFTIESRGTRSKTVRKQRGTLEWMAPEVYDDQVLTKASDVFSFGVVMYECVTRKHPYGVAGLDRARVDATVMAKKLSGKEPCSVKPEDCPREMLALMRWCCDRDVKNRPTMEQVFVHLQNLPDDFSPQDDAELAMEGLQNVQYNHRMMGFLKFQLEKASCVKKPQCATPQQVKEFDCQLDRGHKLLACHKEPFDVRYFQRIGDTHRLVEKICRSLKSILQEWECLDTAGLEDMVPGEYVEEDKQYLHNLLNCILKGSCSDVSDVVLHQIEDVKCDHEKRLPFLVIVKEDSLRLGRQIGCGMDAVVHAAEWKDGCTTVAVKKQYGHCSVEELRCLVANAAVQMALRHEHIVKVHAVTPSGWPVMELADSNLHKLRHDHFAMGWKGKRNLLLQASVGLLFLHSQSPVLVHSGVKPANFLVFGTQPETCKVKVGDIRQVLQSRGEEDVKITVGRGSATWAAPEIYLGDLLTAASDVFSLGVIMYEIVTEQEPYGTRFGAAADAVAMKKKLVGDEPCKVDGKDCPPALQILMKSCCDPEPRNRPTMETVKIQLEQLSPEWAPEVSSLKPGGYAAVAVH
ncbi:unnamed protein product [Ostreobium quekettii]|uniref:Protein kinase domain-containing protein n=1 Tax=Ostreobium quekettii TaxID=121088 RepID=A0A8S1JCA1_9CHLO|nr:unnamed protein product [Ostreobium quekettii]